MLYDLRISLCDCGILLDNGLAENHPETVMDHTSRSRRLQRNEQVKAVSNLAANGGLALFAAGLGQWFFVALDLHAAMWLLDGAALIWAGVMILTLLEAES